MEPLEGTDGYYDANRDQIDALDSKSKKLSREAYWLNEGAKGCILQANLSMKKPDPRFNENKIKRYYREARRDLEKASELYALAAYYYGEFVKLCPAEVRLFGPKVDERIKHLISMSEHCLSESKKDNATFLSQSE